jgi:serralysin
MAKIRGNGLLQGTGAGDEINGGAGSDTIYGFGGRDALIGNGGDDTILGGDGNDHLVGGEGNDYLYGENGDDSLFSGTGADHLWGGAGRDVFDYRYGANNSNLTQGVDTIYDFEQGLDKIDLSALDANVLTPISGRTGNDAFSFVGSAAFTNKPGELRHEFVDGNTFVHADVNGDGMADMTIMLTGQVSLTGTDFFF